MRTTPIRPLIHYSPLRDGSHYLTVWNSKKTKLGSFLSFNPNAFPGHSERQNLGSVLADCLSHPDSCFGLYKEDGAATTTCTTDLGCNSAVATSNTDQFVD